MRDSSPSDRASPAVSLSRRFTTGCPWRTSYRCFRTRSSSAVAEQGFYYLLLIALLNTIISLYYYLLIIKAMFLTKSDEAIAYFKSDLPTRVGLVLCVAGIIAVGLYSPIYEMIRGISFGL